MSQSTLLASGGTTYNPEYYMDQYLLVPCISNSQMEALKVELTELRFSYTTLSRPNSTDSILLFVLLDQLGPSATKAAVEGAKAAFNHLVFCMNRASIAWCLVDVIEN